MLQRLPALLATSLTLLTVITTTIACTAQPEPPTNTVSQAPTDSQWQEVGQLPTPLESHQMLPLGDFVYIIGGWNETKGIHEDAWFTRQNPAGTLDDWQPTTAPLPMKLQHHMTIAHNDAIYVLGGDNGFWDGSSVSDLILRAVPTEDGDITEWAEVGELPEPLTIHAVAMTGDRVYVVGGSNTFRPGDTNMIDRVFTAVITPEGEFEPFETLDPFPTVIGWTTTTIVDNRMFAVSGNEQFRPLQLTENVWVADIEDDQQLSSFEVVSQVGARQRHATVLTDRTLVVIAGGGSQGVLSDVVAAEVDAEGNLGDWAELSPLPAPRYAHAAFAQDGYVYVSGGFIRYGSNETSTQIFRLPLEP